MQQRLGIAGRLLLALEDQIASMRGELTSAKTELANLKANPVVNPMDFSKGVVSIANLTFFIATTAVFLFLTVKILESRRWK